MITSSVKDISKFESWILASRPKTLLAAVVPVVIGTSIAVREDQYNLLAAFVALLCSILIQVGTNFVNDLYDHLAGTDTEKRVGPLRALATGLISVTEMRTGIFLTFGTAFVLGMYLVYMTGWVTLLIGILSIFAGYAYTAGPYPLAYNGLGDIFVFTFFGFVGTVGTYYVQAGDISALAFWASVPVGALITNILVVNNYRDVEQDEIAGKRTLAVKFGKGFTRIQFLLFTIVSYIVPFIVYFTFHHRLIVFLPLLSIPLAIKLIKMLYTLEGHELNKTLELTAKLSLIYGILFSVGILL